MKCREFDLLLCDYLDDGLEFEQRREMDDHALSCTACAEALAESGFARQVMRQAPAIEPPPELIADIIHGTVGVGSGTLAPAGARGGVWGWLEPYLHPFLQPRFVMSMAMTVLSFSMLTFYAQRGLEAYRTGQASPAAAIEALGAPVERLWTGAVEAYEAAKRFYELQAAFDELEEPAAAPQNGPAEDGRQPEEGR